MRPRGTRLDLWKKDLEFHMLRNMLRRQQWGEAGRGVMVAEGHCGHLSSLGIPCSVYRSTVCTSKMYTMHVPCFVSSQSSRTKLIWGRWKSSRGLGWGAGSTNLELVREPPIAMYICIPMVYMVEFAEPSVNKTHDFNSWFA
ncbi:hypothetical protein F4774DRAFT_423011 [Daldinia eschscholtzii]|nr:hypothetical protein F4774DRAFT_423011 [Daldinia eschscholtzii]